MRMLMKRRHDWAPNTERRCGRVRAVRSFLGQVNFTFTYFDWYLILETGRLRGDQIEVFKIVNGYEDVDRNMFFKLIEGSRTRGHKAALVKEQCRLDMRKYSFLQRVINEWNKLPNDCVNANSVNIKKI